jgi:phosphonoacetaldehyde hydrolase
LEELGVIQSYRGPLKAVILDWAGTTVDFGSHAPVVVLQEVFDAQGVPIEVEEARRDMGLLKVDHIRSILALPRVAEAWAVRFGHTPVEADVQDVFVKFIPRQLERLAELSDVIPGAPEAVASLRARGLKIGSTTGYTRPMLDLVCAHAASQGYAPDASVTPDETAGGRPAPWMCFVNLTRLNIYPAAACVKIGDTPSDMQEGVNAGMWTIGVIDSGNEVGLTASEWNRLDDAAQQARRERAAARLTQAGAQFLVHTLADLDPVLSSIEQRLQEGVTA